jgi:hypothetical protein
MEIKERKSLPLLFFHALYNYTTLEIKCEDLHSRIPMFFIIVNNQ